MPGKLTPSNMNSGVVPTPGQAPGQPAPQQNPFRGFSNKGLGGFGSMARMMTTKYQPPTAAAPAPQVPMPDLVETPQIDNPTFKYMPVGKQISEPSLAAIEPAAQKDIKWSGNYDLTPMDKIKSALGRKGIFGGTMGGAGRALGKFNKK